MYTALKSNFVQLQPEDEGVVDVFQHFFRGLDWPQLEKSGEVDQEAEGEDCQYRSPVEYERIG